MPHFRTRRFQPDDEQELNDAFIGVAQHGFPGFSRSLESMRWLWYQAPGGPLESWVIEVQNPDTSWSIVGHHGLCPVRFTLGERDLLCAKTTNTFLLPQYRSKFLYIRFEQQCLAEVLSRYHLFYSCSHRILRLRKPLGYQEDDTWLVLEHGSRYLDIPTRLFAQFVRKVPRAPWMQLARAWAKACALIARKADFEWTEYTAQEAIKDPFFADFWQQARIEAGLSPRRDVADLAWRYWLRPDSHFVTLSHAWNGGARVYCVVNTRNPVSYHLSDFFVTPMRPDLLDEALNSLFFWCARRGALTVYFSTAHRGQSPKLMEVFSRRMRICVLNRFRKHMQLCSYVSPKGRTEIGMALPRWNITELLMPY